MIIYKYAEGDEKKLKEERKLKWYVLNYDVNSHSMKPYNVLGYWEESLYKIRKKIKTKEELKEWLKKEFMYHYWCKAECETMMGGFSVNNEDLEKIDIYTVITQFR